LPETLNREASHGDPTAAATPQVVEETTPHIGLGRLAFVFLRLGTISIGGRSASYILDELVHRRHWLRNEDWLEALTVGKVLPGSTGQTVAAIMAQRLNGARASTICMGCYVLPGALMALLLSTFFFGVERAPWLDGALKGFSAAALGMVLSTSWRTARTVKVGWIGIALIGVTFVTYGLLEVGLATVLLGIGAISVFIHRPRRRTA
jgi:chromate transporter